MTNLIKTFFAGVGITAFTMLVATLLGWDYQFNWLEVTAVATSYSCTLLCVYQSRWNYPIGIVTTFLYSVLFWIWELPAVSLFNLYLVFSLTYGWFRWGPDENTRPVTRLSESSLFVWMGYVLIGLGVYGLLNVVNSYFGIPMKPADVWVAVLSGVAQFLLDNKRLETWIVWAVVNVISIVLFFNQGLHLVTLQYVFFLGNTVYGFILWKRSEDRNFIEVLQ